MKTQRHSRAHVRELVRSRGLYLSRRLGQNFLVETSYLERIREAARLSPGDRVLEIGAGFGVLTELLAEHAGWVVAIEIDEGVFAVLDELAGDLPNVRLVKADVLDANLVQLLDELPQSESTCVGWHAPKVVANLPYSVTTPVIARLLEEVHPRRPLERIVVMVQKEVAERIVAQPGTKDYSSFSILVQYHAKPSIHSIVPASAFFPTPKVDSAILVINMRSAPAARVNDESLFFQLVRAAFALRRKTLANALSANPSFGLDKPAFREALESAGIDPRARGETLSLDDYARLTRSVSARQADGE